jgi:hypothetical protein
MAQPVGLTYKDYEALPADGRRHELHEGALSITPAPGIRHQRTDENPAALPPFTDLWLTAQAVWPRRG